MKSQSADYFAKQQFSSWALPNSVMYRSSFTYEPLLSSLFSYTETRTFFHHVYLAGPSSEPINVFYASNTAVVRYPAAVRFNESLEKGSNLEKKVDMVSEKVSKLSLKVKKTTHINERGLPLEPTRIFSYCRKPGHSANHSDSNPYRDTRCEYCSKYGYNIWTRWSKL